MSTGVRIAPVAPADRSPLQRQLLEPVFGDRAANVFATLVTHPAMFEAWMPFCAYTADAWATLALMKRGRVEGPRSAR
jgi:hypothetical protein